MLPSLPFQKAQNKLLKISLILGLVSVVAALLFHYFSYLFTGSVNNTLLNIFIATPIVIGIAGIIIGMVALRQIMTNNYFGRGKAITGIVLGSVVSVCLLIFLFYLLY